MNARETIRYRAGGGLLAGAALLLAALPGTLGAQVETDSYWFPWLGCWTSAEGVPEAPLLCLQAVPGGGGVELVTLMEGEVVSREVIRADGAEREVDREGCHGWERGSFSADGRRIFLRSELLCEGGVRRGGGGLLAMVSPEEWVDVKVVEVAGRKVPWVLRYQAASARPAVEAGLQDPIADRFMAVRAARMQASAPLGVEDLLEVMAEVDAEALKALLVERGERFPLDARMLLHLADAGVPGDVIDVMVAVSYPQRFVLNTEGDAEARARPASAAMAMSPVWAGRARWGLWDPFYYDPFYYNPYYFGLSSYYSPYGYGGLGWYPYRSVPIIVAPRQPSVPGSHTQGSVVRGRGYTRGGSGSDASSQPSATRGGTSSGASGVSSSGGASGSSTTTRTAKPRGGGGGGDS